MIQRDAARVVTGAIARCSAILLMDEIGWQSLATRRRNHRLALFYKIINGLSPPYLGDLVPGRVRHQTGYGLRRSNDPIVPMCRTSTLLKSFLPNMESEWNRLNVEIKNAGNLSIFKSKTKQSVTKNPLYYYGPRWESIQLARMRMNCSSLRAHLCFHLHVIDNPACVCGEENEDLTHFSSTVNNMLSREEKCYIICLYQKPLYMTLSLATTHCRLKKTS